MPHYMSRVSYDPANFDYARAKFFIQAKNTRRGTHRMIKYVVIHITGGPAMTEQGAVNQFLSGPSSAHYIVNRAGEVIQMVRESDIANHVKNIHAIENEESIGIEHVNPWNSASQLRPTPQQYAASASLVHSICSRYSIPVFHSPNPPRAPGIKGHIEVDPHSHHVSCPNPAWDWQQYIAMVRADRTDFQSLVSGLASGRI